MEYNFKVFINQWVVEKRNTDKIDRRIEIDKYIENKIDCFKDTYSDSLAESTKINYFKVLAKHVHKNELAYGKDLKYFTSIEIEEAVSGVVTNSITTMRNVYASISYYMNWCVARKEISYNPCDGIDTTGLFVLNPRVTKSQYMGLNDFYLYLDNLKCTDVERMLFVLIRYGVPVKEVPNVKWEDLDEKNLVLNVNVGGTMKQLPIDEEFIRRVDLAKACDGKADTKDNAKKMLYIDSGYIIKTKREAKKMSTTTVYAVIEKVCRESEVGRIDLGMLYKNRRYDFAIDIYEEKNELTTDNLKEILDVLGVSCSPNRVTMFKTELDNIFNIDVEVAGRVSIDVVDVANGEVLETYPSIKALSEDSKQKFGFYIDKSIVSKIAKGEREEYKGLTFVKK